MLRDKGGKIINIGGGISDDREGYTLIRGHATFERTDEGTFVNYHGKRFKSTPDKRYAISGTASAVSAADWDGDGDCDLIVGDISGNVHLLPNEGTPKAYAFGKDSQLEVDGEPLRSASSRVGPCVADWDGDGDLDLLLGAGDGSVSLFRNTGTAEEPKLAPAQPLVPPGERASPSEAPAEARRGGRSKVCVADWNGDGKMDLLVGDFAYQQPDRPKAMTEQEKEYERIRKELEHLRKRYGELIQQMRGDSAPRTEEGQKKLGDEMRKVSEQMSALHAKLPREYEPHGWVWLFLRK